MIDWLNQCDSISNINICLVSIYFELFKEMLIKI